MKPILFNTEMVRAIQDGTKTVTRRVVKPQPRAIYYDGKVYNDDGLYVVAENQNGGVEQIELPYRPGDILYVRETWAPFYETMHSLPVIGYRYYSETDEEIKERLPEYLNWYWPGKWSPSIHMPREAARIFLQVTDVKVDRLRDIKEWEAVDEGAVKRPQYTKRGDLVLHRSYIKEFSAIWDKTINPADRTIYGWEANPLVWVIEFEKILKPV